MGKSNKFDFTNRKNSGPDLGRSINKTLVKEAEKLHKDAEKAAGKARKQSSSSSVGFSDVLLDAYSHVIDLQAPAKELGDDGLCALADGLEAALRSGDSRASLTLEDLNLSGNSLTTTSLARLAPIIRLAKLDIKTINLSNNNISVTCNVQAEQWEVFLRSFGDCFKLRRLDLSGNVELGDRAFEILAKVYLEEPPVTPLPPGGDCSLLSLVSEHQQEAENTEETESQDGCEADGLTTGNALAQGVFLRRRSGLRSIPYITLHHTGLTDAGALWLSYLLEEHHLPTQLTDELNAPPPSSVVRVYQQGGECSGVDWVDNKDTLGKEGAYLLHKTEIVRRQVLLDSQSIITESVGIDEAYSGIGVDVPSKKVTHERRNSHSQSGFRRTSIRSIRTADGGEHEMSDLESSRKRIQRHVIDHDKVRSVELWYACVKVVAASRIICWAVPIRRHHFVGLSLFKPGKPTIVPPSSLRGSSRCIEVILPSKNPSQSRAELSKRRSYAAKLNLTSNDSVGQPEFPLTDVTNSPPTPKMLFKPHRKGAFSEGVDLPAVTERFDGLVMSNGDPMRFVKYQQQRIDDAPSGIASYRDVSNASHLPNDVLDNIISYILPDKQAAVLSDAQKRTAMAWGLDRTTLRTELEWRKRDESFQVWMLLDSVKCLSYSQ